MVPWVLRFFGVFNAPARRAKSKHSAGLPSATSEPGGRPAPHGGRGGALAEKAASALMQVLYTARDPRFDLLCAVAKLAQCTATWDEACEKATHCLVCYISLALSSRQV